MKKITMFLIAAASLAFVNPLSAEQTFLASSKEKVNTVKALEGLKLRESTGIITSVDLDKKRIVLKNRRGENAFSVASETQVKKGREKVRPSELKPGIKVTVNYWEEEGKKIARIIKLID